MSSPTLQFVVAGALIAAWAWMLGRPILTNLFRRSRRDSVGHFRYQQAVLSQPMGQQTVSRSWSGRRRPFADWRAQSVEQRRLQLLLGFALATFVSLLLAIALRGVFVRLFALMAVSFSAYVAVAVYIGSSQLRRLERADGAAPRVAVGRRTDVAAAEDAEVDSVATRPILEGDHSPLFDTPPVEDFEDHEYFGQGIFDEGFYEPIPELAFKPLNLDSSLLRPADEQPIESVDHDDLVPSVILEGDDLDDLDDRPGQLFPDEESEESVDHGWHIAAESDLFAGADQVPTPAVPAAMAHAVVAAAPSEEPAVAEVAGRGDDGQGDDGPGEDYSWVGQPIVEFESPLVGASFEAPADWDVDGFDADDQVDGFVAEASPSAEAAVEQMPDPELDPEVAPGVAPEVDGAATFTTAPQQRTRPPKRNKARPIYIESQLDEEDERIKAVND